MLLFYTGIFLIFCSIAGYYAADSKLKERKKELDKISEQLNHYSRLGVDSVSIEISVNLAEFAEKELLPKCLNFRQILTDELGFIIPPIRIFDSKKQKPNQYTIYIRDHLIDSGKIYPEKIMKKSFELKNFAADKNDIEDTDPLTKQKVLWTSKSDEEGENAVNVIFDHLKNCLCSNAYNLLSEEYVLAYIDLVVSNSETQDQINRLVPRILETEPEIEGYYLSEIKARIAADLAENLVPSLINLVDLRKILSNLLKERVSIKDITFIFEQLCDYARSSKNTDILSERLRQDFKDKICQSAAYDNILYAINISCDMSKFLEDSIQEEFFETKIKLEYDKKRKLIQKIRSAFFAFYNETGIYSIILCPPSIRRALFNLLHQDIPKLTVISYNELSGKTDIKITDTINFEDEAGTQNG